MSQFSPDVLIGITKSEPFGGAQRHVLDLATSLSKKGQKVKVLVGGSGPLAKKLEEAGVPVILLPTLKRNISLVQDIRSFIFIWKTLVKEHPYIFHIHSSKMGGLGALAGRILGIHHVVFTSHGWAFNEPRPLYEKIIIKILAWFTMLLSHTTIAVSEKTKSDVEKFPFIGHKIKVVPNGVADFDLLSREVAREALVPGLQSDRLLYGAVSELHPIKGLDILLKAWAGFKKEHEGELVIIGAGGEKEKLEKLARDLGIESTVNFRGFLPEARTFLLGIDVLVIPSHSEGLPYTLLEAGYAGLPVIASNVGGIPEVITDEVSGLLVPPGEVPQLVSALDHLAEHPEKRVLLGKNLEERIKTNFSLEKMAHDTLKIYE